VAPVLAQSTPGGSGASPAFEDRAAASGLGFVHQDGGTPEKYIPETMGGGGLLLDYDGDGWLDVFFVNGGSFVDEAAARSATHGLFRNSGNGTFEDRSTGSGIAVSGYGMGACSADYDNDGDADLYVTSVGENRMYRNDGEGQFSDVTAETDTGYALWSSSCAFADVDNDGDLDLYVVNYVDFAVDNNKVCTHDGDVRVYCHPNVYNGLADVLYRNEGDGTFTDVSRESGIFTTDGKGLGVVFGDYDRDGWIDIYVANDSVPNFMFHNRGDGTFDEVGFLLGVAVSRTGEPLAGMGTDMGDVDGDGFVDVFVTNLNRQTHNLYQNTGTGFFLDMTLESGAGRATLPFVGFGTVFFDYDNDTDLDIAIANGNVIDNVEMFVDDTTYAQRNVLLENDGRGILTDVSNQAGPGFALVKVGRSLASGDVDNDGDLDLLVTNVGQAPDLLVNDGRGAGNAILVRLEGTSSNRDGVGAELSMTAGGQTMVRHVKAGSSYLSQNDLRVHFGLGPAETAETLEIRWPSGTVDTFENLPAGRLLTIRESQGIISQEPFSSAP
jgi:hypothetical protein